MINTNELIEWLLTDRRTEAEKRRDARRAFFALVFWSLVVAALLLDGPILLFFMFFR